MGQYHGAGFRMQEAVYVCTCVCARVVYEVGIYTYALALASVRSRFRYRFLSAGKSEIASYFCYHKGSLDAGLRFQVPCASVTETIRRPNNVERSYRRAIHGRDRNIQWDSHSSPLDSLRLDYP